MTRIPLRPLARILGARRNGDNPDMIERENIRQRNEDMRDRARVRAEGRLLVIGLFFLGAFVVVGLRMADLSTSKPEQPREVSRGSPIVAQRADITDRNGRILATNLITSSLYAQPRTMVDKARAARELSAIFSEFDETELLKKFNSGRSFLWLRRKLAPEQIQAVYDIGEPGLLFGPREMRLYPNGRLASHILGGASFGREGVRRAEVIGVAGVEKRFDDYLRDPANEGAALQLSIDLSVQDATERVLLGGMRMMNARGAASVLMDVYTGEVIAMVSLPDFDPNTRPDPPTTGLASDSPLFNRAVQGVYELGSVFKIFTASQALDEGLVTPQTKINTSGPILAGGFRITDFKNYGPELSVTDVVVRSSNLGAVRIAEMIGAERQQEFMRALGFLDPTAVELVEAPGTHPLAPEDWTDISVMTISYGHGISISPLHLAAGYASILNGGRKVEPTLLRQDGPRLGARIVSQETSRIARDMLRQVVVRGTASFGEVPGYEVGGKTGTADKPKDNGV
ncbi:MAG: peptidoglycan D,D-transpeptidase FtsI family protein, partial [Halocynthiibacter sp.]